MDQLGTIQKMLKNVVHDLFNVGMLSTSLLAKVPVKNIR